MPATLTTHEALEAATALRRQRTTEWRAVLQVIRQAHDSSTFDAFLRLADIAEARYDEAVADEERLRAEMEREEVTR